jgi:4-hydroxyphenylpyruvate dioxygenase-like putative hemolysin
MTAEQQNMLMLRLNQIYQQQQTHSHFQSITLSEKQSGSDSLKMVSDSKLSSIPLDDDTHGTNQNCPILSAIDSEGLLYIANSTQRLSSEMLNLRKEESNGRSTQDSGKMGNEALERSRVELYDRQTLKKKFDFE